jgi:hypothetical protein
LLPAAAAAARREGRSEEAAVQSAAAAKFASLYAGVAEQADRSRVDAQQKGELARMLQQQADGLSARLALGEVGGGGLLPAGDALAAETAQMTGQSRRMRQYLQDAASWAASARAAPAAAATAAATAAAPGAQPDAAAVAAAPKLAAAPPPSDAEARALMDDLAVRHLTETLRTAGVAREWRQRAAAASAEAAALRAEAAEKAAASEAAEAEAERLTQEALDAEGSGDTDEARRAAQAACARCSCCFVARRPHAAPERLLNHSKHLPKTLICILRRRWTFWRAPKRCGKRRCACTRRPMRRAPARRSARRRRQRRRACRPMSSRSCPPSRPPRGG